MSVRALWYEPGTLHLLDQRRLPGATVVRKLHRLDEVAEAIRDMTVRGAPSIGAAAAMPACDWSICATRILPRWRLWRHPPSPLRAARHPPWWTRLSDSVLRLSAAFQLGQQRAHVARGRFHRLLHLLCFAIYCSH